MKKIFTILVMLVALNASGQWALKGTWNTGGNTIKAIAGNGNNIFVGTNTDGLHRSTDNGETWVKTSLNEYTVLSLAISGNNIFAGTLSGGVYLSTDNGNSWTQTVLNGLAIPGLFIQGNYIYASTYHYPPYVYKVYFSTNNGTTWVETNLDSIKITCFTYDGNYIYAALGEPIPDNNPPVYRSLLGGTSWSLISYIDSLGAGTRQCVSSLASLGNNIFSAMSNFQGYTKSVYQSTDYGIHWLPTALDEGDAFTLTTIGNAFMAGTSSGVFLTTNNGTNWINKNQGLPNSEDYFFSCKNINNIFTATRYSIWRRSLTEIVGIQNISTESPSTYSLSQNYPNPFNSMCNLQFSMSNAGNVKLVVYDVQGREVQTLVNERLQAGTYETSFDGSALNSGVYFYKLIVRHGGSSTEGFTETKRMILIK